MIRNSTTEFGHKQFCQNKNEKEEYMYYLFLYMPSHSNLYILPYSF